MGLSTTLKAKLKRLSKPKKQKEGQWPFDEHVHYFETFLPEYLRLQAELSGPFKYSSLWPKLFQGYFERWPERPNFAPEHPLDAVLPLELQHQINEAVDKRRTKIKSWFDNKTRDAADTPRRISCRGTNLLKRLFAPKTRTFRDWEIYSRKCYHADVKHLVERDLAAGTGTHLQLVQKHCQEQLALALEADPMLYKEIQDFKAANRKPTTASKVQKHPPESHEAALAAKAVINGIIPGLIQILNECAELTQGGRSPGWCFSLALGGRDPLTGEITGGSIHVGLSEAQNTFGMAHSDWETTIMPLFENFLISAKPPIVAVPINKIDVDDPLGIYVNPNNQSDNEFPDGADPEDLVEDDDETLDPIGNSEPDDGEDWEDDNENGFEDSAEIGEGKAAPWGTFETATNRRSSSEGFVGGLLDNASLYKLSADADEQLWVDTLSNGVLSNNELASHPVVAVAVPASFTRTPQGTFHTSQITSPWSESGGNFFDVGPTVRDIANQSFPPVLPENYDLTSSSWDNATLFATGQYASEDMVGSNDNLYVLQDWSKDGHDESAVPMPLEPDPSNFNFPHERWSQSGTLPGSSPSSSFGFSPDQLQEIARQVVQMQSPVHSQLSPQAVPSPSSSNLPATSLAVPHASPFFAVPSPPMGIPQPTTLDGLRSSPRRSNRPHVPSSLEARNNAIGSGHLKENQPPANKVASVRRRVKALDNASQALAKHMRRQRNS